MKQSKAQVLITGVYRSGTEYITNFLNQHPEIVASMYRINFFRFVRGRYHEDLTPSSILHILKEVDERIGKRYRLHLNSPYLLERMASIVKPSIYDLYDQIMTSIYLRCEPASVWAEKNQLLWRELKDFTRTMNNGFGVLILRDPRSVLASFKRYTVAKSPLYLEAIFNCVDCMQHALDFTKCTGNSRIKVIRYEDFVESPILKTNEIAAFLELETQLQNNLNETIWRDAYGQPWYANSSFVANVPNAFDIDEAINRWRTNLSADEIALTEYVCGDLMSQLGYVPQGKKVCGYHIRSFLQSLPETEETRRIYHHLEKWQDQRTGIQQFPLDPLDSATWDTAASKA